MNRPLRLALLLLLALGVGSAEAHTRGASYSDWQLAADGSASAQVRVSELELTRLQLHPEATPDYLARVGQRLTQDLQLSTAGQPCKAQLPKLTPSATPGWLLARWTLQCQGSTEPVLESRLLFAVAPGHNHFASLQLPDGRSTRQVLTAAVPVMQAGEAHSAPAGLLAFMRLGLQHILGGWDHLAFVAALLLAAAKLREVVLVVTGFTLAHSATLAAAALGLVQVESQAVEALIGFSIAIVAAEGLWLKAEKPRWLPWALVGGLLLLATLSPLPRLLPLGLALFVACSFALLRRGVNPARLRLPLSFVFGLIHGFGFAAVLAGMQMPRAELLHGLLGFNLGVELGQLAVVACGAALLWLLEQRLGWKLARPLAMAAVLALGSYWFLLRSV